MAHTAAQGVPAWFEVVATAFPDPKLQQRIFIASSRDRELPQLFQDIAHSVLTSTNSSLSHDVSINSKKRKLVEAPNSSQPSSAALAHPVTDFACKDVSVQIPARKKLKLELVSDAQDGRRRQVRLLHPTTNELEYTLPATNIDHAFCMPVPDKQARQMNFVLYPKPDSTSADGTSAEPFCFALNEIAAAGIITSANPVGEDETVAVATEKALNRFLSPYGKHVVRPQEQEFASSIPQSHRKGEKAFHVRAHRGSKEGYLFFLSTGIFFGFKKPLAFFAFAAIDSISYTSVLQRTFNLVIAETDGGTSTKEIEFSMLDQADFAGIDDYIKRHALNDASMAAERRAKAYHVNKERKGEANGDVGGVAQTEQQEEESELQKAEQQLQDEEDEEEEDYEVSGGESDGEGEYSSEEEDDGEGYAEQAGEGDEGGNEEVEHEEDIHDQ